MKLKTISYTLALFLVIACTTNPYVLTVNAQKVEVIGSSSKTCDVIGLFKGEHKKGSVELARNQARNSAAKKGADTIFFSEEFSNGANWTVYAIGYHCKK